MKIAIIAPQNTFQINSLISEAIKRNHQIERLQLAPIELTNYKNDKTIGKLSKYDLVYFRNGTDLVTKMILGKELIERGIPFINSGYYLNPLLSDKKYQSFVTSQNGILTPKSLSLKIIDSDTFEYIKETLGIPFILKPTHGAKGFGVEIIKNEQEFNKLPREDLHKFLFQEYIENDGDYRVIVVNHKAVGTFKRIPPTDDFRANISQGGKGELVEDSKLKNNLYEIAEKVTRLLNLEIAGIDIIKSLKNDKLYFIESNSIPQWEGFTKTTNINVSGEILNYFEQLIIDEGS